MGAGWERQYPRGGGRVFSTLQGTFTLAGDGLHGLLFYSEDKLGQRETERAARLVVDGEPPLVTVMTRSPVHHPRTGCCMCRPLRKSRCRRRTARWVTAFYSPPLPGRRTRELILAGWLLFCSLFLSFTRFQAGITGSPTGPRTGWATR